MTGTARQRIAAGGAVVLAAGGGWLIGDALGAGIAGLVAATTLAAREFGGIAVVAAAAATTVATLTEGHWGESYPLTRFVRQRPSAGQFGLYLGAALIGYLAGSRRGAADEEAGPDPADPLDDTDGSVAARGESSRTHHIAQGSVWVMGGFLVQALTGLGFWWAAANRSDAATIGVATGLFTSLQFVNYLTTFGLPELLSRFPPRGDVDAIGAWAAALSLVTSLGGSLIYLFALHTDAATEARSAGATGVILFSVIAAGCALAALVDSRLMGARRWTAVFWRLVVTGFARLPLVWIPGGPRAALWWFVVLAAPIALSGFVGWAWIHRGTGVVPRFGRPLEGVRHPLRFAGVSAVSQLALLAPQFALPVVVLVNVEPATYANFFLAWSIAAVAFILPISVGRVLITEGSQDRSDVGRSTRTALAVGGGTMALATLGSLGVSFVLPAAYGPDFAEAARVLPWVVAGGLPWSMTSILLARSRLARDGIVAIAVPLTLAVTVLGGAAVLVPRSGLDGAVTAWALGNVVASLVAGALWVIRGVADADIHPHPGVGPTPQPEPSPAPDDPIPSTSRR